eukprot:c20183_g1_i2.p1 GENE.c20183_g1_i2~~c20183_g1_i2.p1  ORF type:complete len:995 (+),score=180.09 c20183_g1_i2:38-3022(+)
MKLSRVVWSPLNRDHFAVVHDDIRIFSVSKQMWESRRRGRRAASPNQIAMLSVDSITAFGWSPIADKPFLMGIGKDKHIFLANLDESASSGTEGSLVAEFVPHTVRRCNDLAFSPLHPSWMAVGLDRSRADNCLVVYDCASDNVRAPHKRISNSVYESSRTEAVLCLSWHPSEQLVACGTSFKWMRLYDMKQSTPVVTVSVCGRAVTSVSYDPFNPTRIASTQEDDVVKVWDIRNTATPLVEFEAVFRHSEASVMWCPTRPGIIAAISQAGKSISIWNILDASDTLHSETQILDSPIREHVMDEKIWTFSFHPSVDSAVLTLKHTNKPTPMLCAIPHAIPIVLSQSNQLVSAHGSQVISSMGDDWASDDVSRLIQDRAGQGYGLSIDGNISMFEKRCCSANRASSDLALLSVWRWMQACSKHSDELIALAPSTSQAATPQHTSQSQSTLSDITPNNNNNTLAQQSNAFSRPSASPRPGSGSRFPPSLLGGLTSRAPTPNMQNVAANLKQGTTPSLHTAPLTPDVIPGIIELLEAERDSGRAQEQRRYGGESGDQSLQGFTGFRSPARDLAQKLCGWPVLADDPADLNELCSSLEATMQHERAAALQLFSLNLTKAIECLRTGAVARPNESTLFSVLAAMLAGHVGQVPTAMWRDLCLQLASKPLHPYLRMSLLFLASAGEISQLYSVLEVTSGGSIPHVQSTNSLVSEHSGSFGNLAILGETPQLDRGTLFVQSSQSGVEELPTTSLEDRIAFAVRFLPTNDLIEKLKLLAQQCQQSGSIEGLRLTGLGTEGYALLQAYVDYTHDIQTAALVLCPFPHKRSSSLPMARHWLERYRELLNQFQLWEFRASLDCALARLEKTSVPPQSFVKCLHCSKSLCNKVGEGKTGIQHKLAPRKTAADTTNSYSCPHCHKPLPRCGVCMMALGSRAAPSGHQNVRNTSSIVPDGEDFYSWFSWCQTCRHGGHALHLLDWFSNHVVCPVTGCDCRCFIQDACV